MLQQELAPDLRRLDPRRHRRLAKINLCGGKRTFHLDLNLFTLKNFNLNWQKLTFAEGKRLSLGLEPVYPKENLSLGLEPVYPKKKLSLELEPVYPKKTFTWT